MSRVQASAVKAGAEMDVFPQELKALTAFQLTSQGFITVIDNDALTGVQVDLDLTAIGGAPNAYLEGGAWNAGGTAAESATALAAVMAIDMAVEGGTAVADGETVILTSDPTVPGDFAAFPVIEVDAPAALLINDAWGSELETFHSFWDSEFNGGGNVPMNANDYLHLLVRAQIVAGAGVLQAQIRLKFGMGEAANGHGQMYDDLGMDVGAVAANVLPITLPVTEYQINLPRDAADTLWYYKRLAIPVNDPIVKVLVTTDNVPGADDTLEVLFMRTLRESVTGS